MLPRRVEEPAEGPAAGTSGEGLPGGDQPETLFAAGRDAYRAGDHQTALTDFLQAAELGHAESQFLCGQMYRRGVDRELWDSALEELPDPAEILDRLIQKKCRGELSDPREKKRVSDALLRRGFSWSEVRSAMGRYAEMEEDGYD